MNDFHIAMRWMFIDGKGFYYVQYWYKTDLRTDSKTADIPIHQIDDWVRNTK